MGTLWLEGFAASDSKDFTSGVGETKYSDVAFIIAQASDFKDLPLRSSVVASYLHDHPSKGM